MSLPADDLTPINSIEAYKRQYLIDWFRLYHDFFEKIGVRLTVEEIGGGENRRDRQASRQLFSDISHGVRRLDWCPAGLSLYGNLQPFLRSKGMELYTDDEFIQGRLFKIVTAQSAWMVVSESRFFASSQEHKVSVHHGSGVFDDLRVPDVVQQAYLICAMIYRYKKIAVASVETSRTMFVRTCTTAQLGEIIAISYVPGMGLFFKAFPGAYSGPDLVTMDAFILP